MTFLIELLLGIVPLGPGALSMTRGNAWSDGRLGNGG